ncbi:endonuclease/exonuclease/phosphatase family protein [Akkermansiaceae bacterium]|nr:endonuclease/exonuclease/phosphatase family protein [Akkermansiaceae bacterium]
MRILTWNLMHGGGPRIDRIKVALEPYKADVLILSEFRNNPQGADLRNWLKNQGYGHQAAPEGPPGLNTVLVAARHPFESQTFPGEMSDPELGSYPESVILARFEKLNVFGLYLPGEERKRPVFDFLLDLPERYLAEDTMLIGDMNTGRHYEDEAGKTFTSAHQFDAMLGQGWVDAWRTRNPEAREFTWYSNKWKNGFRLDHALVSPSLDARITEVRYSHGEREARVTDHSIMLVECG